MSSRRGLLSSSRRAEHSSAAASASRPGRSSGAAELPPYEPPSFPLNETATRALAEISNNRDTKTYEKHLKNSAQFLRESVGAVNDRLGMRRLHVDQLAGKKDANEEKAAAYETAREIYERLDPDVSDLSTRSEAALREVIDMQIQLHDENEVISALAEEVRARQERALTERRAREVERGSDDDAEMEDVLEEPVAVTGVVELLKSGREAKAADYNKLGMYEKYGLNNDYVSFKKTWHDAVNQDNEVPLPDATTWFEDSGRSRAKGKGRGRGRKTQANDDDDDIVVEREVISYTCPLTLMPFKEPYSNKLCKHTFEKDAILGMIRQSHGVVRCPQTGCSQTLRASDFYLDDLIMRKMKRAEQAQRRGVEYTSDIEPEEDPDTSMVVEGSRNIKTEPRGRGRPRRVAEDVDDD
ncbi:E3 SUMO-protein ligase nse2 [Pleurostoma richardsiae]|uniref:E3 SUMO-protein ligase nse2 n=1 Tax=Pleurostoma richardsiae TaxID=41990 RepID=A0AA38VHJ4_9PEZI|nr:E3 SUMO-protein ligase nse2 [Pleurostoma richardsiae]